MPTGPPSRETPGCVVSRRPAATATVKFRQAADVGLRDGCRNLAPGRLEDRGVRNPRDIRVDSADAQGHRQFERSGDHYRQVTHGVLKAGLTRRDFLRADRKVGPKPTQTTCAQTTNREGRSIGSRFKDQERAGEQLRARR